MNPFEIPVKNAPSLLVIGCSAGGMDALLKILPALPREMPFATAVVIHLPPDSDSMLARIFGPKVRAPAKEAEDKEEIRANTIYFAVPSYHLAVEPEGCFSLSVDDPVNFSRPSIDVFFESAAAAYGSRVVGILLTGANSDGAEGLRAIVKNGGRAIVQDPKTAENSAMPEAGIRALTDAPDHARFILPLEGIAKQLQDPRSLIMENLWKR